MNQNKPTLIFSGGAKGADTIFNVVAQELCIPIINFSFTGHYYDKKKIKPSTIYVLPPSRLYIGKPYLEKAITNRRLIHSNKTYVNNLLLRDYWQVKDSECVLAIGKIKKILCVDGSEQVDGGTGYAVEFAKQENKPIYLIVGTTIYIYDYKVNGFTKIDKIPNLQFKKVACVGSRNIENIKSTFNYVKKIFMTEVEKGDIDEQSR